MRNRKTQLTIVATLLLVLGLASVSFSWPLPLQAIDRTQVTPTVLSPVTIGDQSQIEGVVVHFADFSVTADEDTTAACYLGGLIPWRVINESGAAATLTFWDATSLNGTALATIDQDDVAIAAITISDDESQELPSSLAGCTYIVISGAVVGDHFTLVCKR